MRAPATASVPDPKRVTKRLWFLLGVGLVAAGLADWAAVGIVNGWPGTLMLFIGIWVAASNKPSGLMGRAQRARLADVTADLETLLNADDVARTHWNNLTPDHRQAYLLWCSDPWRGPQRAIRVDRVARILFAGPPYPWPERPPRLADGVPGT